MYQYDYGKLSRESTTEGKFLYRIYLFFQPKYAASNGEFQTISCNTGKGWSYAWYSNICEVTVTKGGEL